MSSWAAPGVKCVCIIDDWQDIPGMGSPSRLPMINEVLTIKEVMVAGDLNSLSSRFQFVGEAARTVIISFHELGHDWFFAVRNFRPLITKTQEQDLALFRHLLSPSPADVGLIPAGVELDA